MSEAKPCKGEGQAGGTPVSYLPHSGHRGL